MMRQSIAAIPDGLPVSTVAMSDEYDPVTMWLRAHARPFYDRDAHAGPAGGGYGYPRRVPVRTEKRYAGRPTAHAIASAPPRLR